MSLAMRFITEPGGGLVVELQRQILRFPIYVVTQIKHYPVAGRAQYIASHGAHRVLYKICAEQKDYNGYKHFFVGLRDYLIDKHFGYVRRQQRHRGGYYRKKKAYEQRLFLR